MKNVTMGNQQGNYYEIGYLLGMIDGEGSVSIVRSGKTKTAPLFCKLQPYITICGTDIQIMDKVVMCCEKLNLPYHIRTISRGTKYKEAIRVEAYGLGRVQRWIDCLMEYEFGKKERMELVAEYIKERSSKISKQAFSKPYSEREIEIYNAVRMFNQRGGKSRHIFTKIDPTSSSVKNRVWKEEKMNELIDKGWTQEKIAKFFSIDQSSVCKWINRRSKTLNDYHLERLTA